MRFQTLRAHFASPADVWLALRIAAWALVLPALKLVLPLPRLARLMYKPGRGGTRRMEREERIARFVDWVHRPLVRADEGCLQRSLLAYRFLSEANAEPELYVGVQQRSGTVRGHAWVSVEGHPIGESAAWLNAFVPVLAFGREGALTLPAKSEEQQGSVE